MSEQAKQGFVAALQEAFPFFKQDDDKNAAYSFESGAGYTGSPYHDREHHGDQEKQASLTKEGGGRLFFKKLPSDRFMLYEIYDEMAEDSTLDAALNLHLSQALSVSNRDQRCVYLKAKDEKDTEYVEQLNKELMSKINAHIFNWSYPMVKYGVNYVRPYVQQGRGITHFEMNYYTLANQICEYERSGELCGFTAEYLKVRENNEQVRLAEPWALIPLKLPIWRPDMKKPPVNYSGQNYSLYDDAYNRHPIETQNYGTSLLHSTFESWTLLRQSIAAMGASRVNASLIDRLVTVNTAGLDTAGAAEYINLIAEQMQQDRQAVVDKSRKRGLIPTVLTTLLPMMNGDKGGLNIDTFTTDPNISHIEDIMFHLKRMAGTLGVDPSMLGFGDLLSGGLGDGGFFRTSIQSALRANQIRSAVTAFVRRAIDIHTIYRDSKFWVDGDEPFEICFNSINTALAQEEAADKEATANYATILATVLDLIEQSPIGKSETVKSHFYTSILELEPDMAKQAISELASNAAKDDKMMESLGMNNTEDAELFVRDTVMEMMNEIRMFGGNQ
ncbi:portal protein [Vibrio parahaemolyticus]|nr:hypothetical protein [Vibrio parahaemolyticus]MDF4901798.1 portal protein [Vibrio parahaemolyticus]HCG7330456.1 hypothetical protein [Vibrio parahaemolyticus]HCG8859912.1 hypothetical protein [Vibrio parahaemolyticus]HCG9589035.1 hypothetical protein [Vibrio parahaemolyticus]